MCTEKRLCSRCGEEIRLVLKVPDLAKNSYVRVYQCRCSEIAWEDDPRSSPAVRNEGCTGP